MPKFTFVVFTNPAEGREDEFNDWYTHQHVPDVLKVPGIVSAQRFRLTDQQRVAGPHPYKYLAIYECDAPEPNAVTEAIKARAGTADMVMSTSMGEPRTSWYFEPITELKRSAS